MPCRFDANLQVLPRKTTAEKITGAWDFNVIGLPWGSAAPAATACDEDAERGRTYVQIEAAAKLWLCKGTAGWEQPSGGSTPAPVTSASAFPYLKVGSDYLMPGSFLIAQRPPAAGWTFLGASVPVGAPNGSIELVAALDATNYWYDRALPAGATVLTAHLSMDVYRNNMDRNSSGAGLYIRSGGTKRIASCFLFHEPTRSFGFLAGGAERWTNNGAQIVDYVTGSYPLLATAAPDIGIWMRVTVTGADLTCAVSHDGAHWSSYQTAPHELGGTMTSWGIRLQSGDHAAQRPASVRVLSLREE